jgi:hypothetical protein
MSEEGNPQELHAKAQSEKGAQDFLRLIFLRAFA